MRARRRLGAGLALALAGLGASAGCGGGSTPSTFAYDRREPFRHADAGVVNHGYPIKIHDVSFASARSGRVHAYLIVPPPASSRGSRRSTSRAAAGARSVRGSIRVSGSAARTPTSSSRTVYTTRCAPCAAEGPRRRGAQAQDGALVRRAARAERPGRPRPASLAGARARPRRPGRARCGRWTVDSRSWLRCFRWSAAYAA